MSQCWFMSGAPNSCSLRNSTDDYIEPSGGMLGLGSDAKALRDPYSYIHGRMSANHRESGHQSIFGFGCGVVRKEERGVDWCLVVFGTSCSFAVCIMAAGGEVQVGYHINACGMVVDRNCHGGEPSRCRPR